MLLVVHDMAYAEKRSTNTQRYLLWFVLGVSLIAATVIVIASRLALRRWILTVRDFVRTGQRTKGLPRETISITREIQQRIRKLEREQQRLQLWCAQWSAESLYDFISNNLPSEQIIAVSYREPYVHGKTSKGLSWTTPVSGLVSALEPIMKACRGTWVAVSSGDADRDAADEKGILMVPPNAPCYRLKRLWLTKEQETGFYEGFANEGLWPLCSLVFVKPRFRASDWETYRDVNRMFLDAIVAEAKTSSPIVFIQDYHFGLLPRMVRERFPDAVIVIFWHITWPNSETLSILPWREEFLESLLAADIVGFHTQQLCNNFLDCVDAHIEALVDREHDTVRHGDDFCMIRPYPISIAWPDFQALGVPSLSACRDEIVSMLNLDPKNKIVLGVERMDYIKGIPERLRAFDAFLEQHSEWKGKVSFVQIASPSRSAIRAYADVDREVEGIAAAVNAKYGREGWTPVCLLKKTFTQADVYRFYRAADVCIVSSLHDGMNLVAKEFVAGRDDNRGVLILSQFSGSSRELVDAVIVNPYDEIGLTRSIERALTMGPEEQEARMKSMREHTKAHNVFAWAAQILDDAGRLHQRRRLNELLKKEKNFNVSEEEGEAS